MRTIQDLKEKQALPLDVKIMLTKIRIKEWVNTFGRDGVYVSFSGGKDSTVLLDIVRNECGYKDIPAVFVDVPTQYPELRHFAKTFDNVEIVRPKMSFLKVCEQYGFPLISKEVSGCVEEAKIYLTRIATEKTILDRQTDRQTDRPYQYAYRRIMGIGEYARESSKAIRLSDKGKQNKGEYDRSDFSFTKYKFLLEAPFSISQKCCGIMKKAPLHEYQIKTKRKPMIGTMAVESLLRQQAWINNGCNAFNSKKPKSNPMSFWTEQDVLQYIYESNLPICSVYGEVIKKDNQLSLLDMGVEMDGFRPCYETTGCDRTGCVLCGFGAHLEKGKSRYQRLHITHPGLYSLLDVATNNGYTMRQAIEWVNEHGNVNIKL